jgi:predicted PhzF superfamily epimerase YddE/YHI9
MQTVWEVAMMILKRAAIGVAAFAAAVAVAAPASADDATPDSAGGRYMFNKTADGVVRLDTQSGEVSLCSQKSVGWACEAVPEDRAVLENEIARLRAENAALKKDILARGLPLPPGAAPEPSAAQSSTSSNSITVPLPSDADIDRMTAFANKVWNSLKDMVERAQQQIFNKS